MRMESLCSGIAALCLTVGIAAADEFVLTTDNTDDYLLIEDAPSTAEVVLPDVVLDDRAPTRGNNPVRRDYRVQQAQARSGGNRSNTVRTASRSGRTRVPYMIGDSPYGSPSQHSGLMVEGLDLADVSHPVFGGNRFNAAEAGTFLPQDRFFFTYRHMHNVNTTNVMGFLETNDVEQFVLGFEKTALDGMVSAEIRVPLLRQLDSDLSFTSTGSANSYFGDRDGEFGNMSVNLKALLTSNRRRAVAAGLAVNIPTADDLAVSQVYDTTTNISQTPLIDGTIDLTINSWFENNTTNLTPYLVWACYPTSRFFHQGFLQVDVPLNSSGARVEANGSITPDSDYSPENISVAQVGEFSHQTLLRMNLGFGYWLSRGRRNNMPSGVAALLEVHYTGSLDSPPGFSAPIATLVDGGATLPDIPIDANAGTGDSSFDVVNLSTGLAIDLGTCVVTNGFILPVTDNDRFYDFEYNLQVNKRF